MEVFRTRGCHDCLGFTSVTWSSGHNFELWLEYSLSFHLESQRVGGRGQQGSRAGTGSDTQEPGTDVLASIPGAGC